MAQYFPVYGYKKYYRDGENNGVITGTILLANSMPELLVIDVDNKSKPSDRLQNYQNLLAYFVPKNTENVYIERTGNYGLHIILVNDLDLTDAQLKNRWCSIYNDWFYSLDIFVTANKESRNCLMITKPHADGLKGLNGVKLLSRDKTTRIKAKDGSYSSMEIISKCDNFINSTMTFSQYSKWLLEYSEIDISNFQQIIKIQDISKPKTISQRKETGLLEQLESCIEEINISESNVQILCDCISDIAIHNYSGVDIKTEFSLLPYFRSILSLSQRQTDQIVDYVFKHGKLTENAKQNYYSTYERVKKTQQPFKDLSILITMIKYNNPSKYSEYKNQLQNLIEKYQHNVPSYITDRKNRIDFRTSVSYTDVFDQNDIQQYIAVEDWFTQVQQVLMYNTADNCYYRKYKNEIGKQYMILQQISLQDIKDVLANIKINNIKLYDYLIEHRQYIQYNSIKTISDNPRVFSRFCGFCYSAVQNDEIIKPYLGHIKEIIANNDEKVYDYIVSWLAYLIQKPSQKLGTALVIIGGQGTGKNTFTTPIVNLLGYYADEINDMNCVIGNFNPMLEGKHLLVCNEITQQYDTATNKANFDKMKSLITDCYLQINQKNEKVRTVENIANFIMLSNHNKPVVLEQDDRRYCVCRTASKRDLLYYKQLQDLYKKQEFYEALLYYLQNQNISAFYPQNIPMTEDKQRILKISESPLYQFVIKSQIRRSNISLLFENYKKYMKTFYNLDVSTKKNEFRNNCTVYYNKCKSNSVRYYQLKQQYIVPYNDFYDDDDDFIEYIQSIDVGENFQQFNQHIPTLINQLKNQLESINKKQ